MCSSDDFMDIEIGDANKYSIHELWHGKLFQKVRQQHEKKMDLKKLNHVKTVLSKKNAGR